MSDDKRAAPTGDELRQIVAKARLRNGPSDTTGPGEYALAGWQAREPELDALRERVKELERDAARYRWLRDKANYARKSDPMVCLNPLDDQSLIDGPELDTAIDAAITPVSRAPGS